MPRIKNIFAHDRTLPLKKFDAPVKSGPTKVIQIGLGNLGNGGAAGNGCTVVPKVIDGKQFLTIVFGCSGSYTMPVPESGEVVERVPFQKIKLVIDPNMDFSESGIVPKSKQPVQQNKQPGERV